MKSLNNLLKLIDVIEMRVPDASKSNTKISKANVAWHLDHSLKVIIAISKQLIRSKASDYKADLNFSRSILFILGFIPRGKGKSPKVVLPPDRVLIEDIFSQLQMAKELVPGIEGLSKNSNFTHPFFGNLNKSMSIRFIEMHTKHHLKIINDILE